jgi:drug/metabolite transporter (DMT)-like permease
MEIPQSIAVKHLRIIEYSIISYTEPLAASLIGVVFCSESLTLF